MNIITLMFGMIALSLLSIDSALAVDQNVDKNIQFNTFHPTTNDKNELSIIKTNTKLSKDNILDSLKITVDKGVKFNTARVTSIMLADSFEYRYELDQLYANNDRVGSNYSKFPVNVSNDRMDIIYKSMNSKTLRYSFPLQYIDISYQPVYSLKSNQGIYVREIAMMLALSGSNNRVTIDDRNLAIPAFPAGSECIKYGKIDFNFPHYQFELDTYDVKLKKVVPNKLKFNSIKQLIKIEAKNNPEFLNLKMDRVGINNNINVVRLLSDNKFFDTAYIEYNNAVYKTVYMKSYSEESNSDPSLGYVACTGFNNIASDHLEKLYVKLFKD